jgi:hypothetical protein
MHVFVMDIERGKPRQVSAELNVEILGCCWSPDGNRVAYAWRQIHAEPQKDAFDKKPTESCLMTVALALNEQRESCNIAWSVLGAAVRGKA